MYFKKTLKTACISAAIFSFTSNANASWKHNIGIGYGMGVFKYNESRENSTFIGDTRPMFPAQIQPILKALGAGNPNLRTSYKYIENLPQRILHLEAGTIKSFPKINLLEKNFFAGATLGFGLGKINTSRGLTNPNARYLSTGSTGIFWALNARFGLESAKSKIYGLLGLAYAKADLPYDVLPLGSGTKLGDLNSQVVMQENSLLLQSVGDASLVSGGSSPIPITQIADLTRKASSQIQVRSTSQDIWFISIGAGLEANLTPKLTVFAEYHRLMQLNRGKTRSIDYTVNGVNGTFRGVIHSTDSGYVKAGLRYYFG